MSQGAPTFSKKRKLRVKRHQSQLIKSFNNGPGLWNTCAWFSPEHCDCIGVDKIPLQYKVKGGMSHQAPMENLKLSDVCNRAPTVQSRQVKVKRHGSQLKKTLSH